MFGMRLSVTEAQASRLASKPARPVPTAIIGMPKRRKRHCMAA